MRAGELAVAQKDGWQHRVSDNVGGFSPTEDKWFYIAPSGNFPKACLSILFCRQI
jgi:hypothetical protein